MKSTLAICLAPAREAAPTNADRALLDDMIADFEEIELPCDSNLAWQVYYNSFSRNVGFPPNCFPFDYEEHQSRLHFDIEVLRKILKGETEDDTQEKLVEVEKYKHLGGISPKFWMHKIWDILRDGIAFSNEQAVRAIAEEFNLEISFGKSTSRNYQKALKLASRNFETVESAETGSSNRFVLASFHEYLEKHEAVLTLVDMVRRIKSFSISVNERSMKTQEFLKMDKLLCAHAGQMKWLLSREDLPLPHATYPTKGTQPFFLYRKAPGEPCYLCECDRARVEVFKGICRQRADSIPDELENPNYLPNLCHRCNKTIPKRQYGHPMYYSKFMQKFGWYCDQNMTLFGITELSPFSIDCLRSAAPAEILSTVDDMLSINKADWESKKESCEDIRRYFENYTRQEFGYPKIGEKWISETMLFHAVQSALPDQEVIFHARPEWLEGLELDIYVPGKDLAFEYQGIQHYQAVKHWGGEEKLREQQARDAKKRAVCAKRNVSLIEWKYDQEVTPEAVAAAIMSAGV